MKKGFTLIELMFVIGLTIIVSISLLLSLSGFNRRSHLSNAEKSIKAALREAQQRAITQDSGYYWGVRFSNGAQDNYKIFSANNPTITNSTNTKTIFLKPTLEFLAPVSGVTTTVLFNKITGALIQSGCPSATVSSTVRIGVVSQLISSSTVRVFCNGRIE